MSFSAACILLVIIISSTYDSQEQECSNHTRLEIRIEYVLEIPKLDQFDYCKDCYIIGPPLRKCPEGKRRDHLGGCRTIRSRNRAT